MEKAHVITDFIKKGFETGTIDMMTDGTEEREFLYAEDCCEALEKVMEYYDHLHSDDDLHITTGDSTSIWALHERFSPSLRRLVGRLLLLPLSLRMRYKRMPVMYQTHTLKNGGNRRLV